MSATKRSFLRLARGGATCAPTRWFGENLPRPRSNSVRSRGNVRLVSRDSPSNLYNPPHAAWRQHAPRIRASSRFDDGQREADNVVHYRGNQEIASRLVHLRR